jgi:hypothetical protein
LDSDRNSNRNINASSDCNEHFKAYSNTDCNLDSSAYTDPMHEEMSANAAAAPYSGTAPIAFAG